jgi:hypothetical protein
MVLVGALKPLSERKLASLPLLSLPVLVCALGGALSAIVAGRGAGLDGTLMAMSYVGSPALVPGGVTTGVRTAVL